MQFLLGLFFGALLTAEGFVTSALLAPFVLVALGLMGWGAYEAVVWFDISSSAYQSAPWYAWPWHWPGAHLAKEVLAAIAPLPVQAPSPGNLLSAVSGWLFKLIHAITAIGINFAIFFLPFFILNKLVKVYFWIANKAPQSAN